MTDPCLISDALVPTRTAKSLWNEIETLAERPAGEATHPISGEHLGPAFDRLYRVTDGARVYWQICGKVDRDGVAQGGGTIYTRRRQAVSAWNERPVVA